jgi:ABC-2 type transport system permease protein
MLANIFTKTIRDQWKAEAIGAVTVVAMFVLGMAMYRDMDLSVFTEFPSVFRSLIGVSETVDPASLAYGAIYGAYGAIAIIALAIWMGSISVAGEERNGTIGLLLGNPKSRATVLVSKAGSLVLLTALGCILMWGAGVIGPRLLNVDVAGMDVGAFVFHIFVNALFYGFLALAVGGWTGKGTLAGGIATGVMIVSFVGYGLLPLVERFEDGAKAFPWYYYEAGQPLLNGVDWGRLTVLFGGIVLFAAAAVVGVNRRDLRSQAPGTTLLDRLRDNPMTKRVVDHLAGSARVSAIWVKTASEHLAVLLITATFAGVMGVMIGPLFALIDNTLLNFAEEIPKAMLALFGGGDMGTPEGFYQSETFGMLAPIAVMIVTVTIGARAAATEEARNTMGLLLANPIRRSTVLLQKTVTMIIYAFVVGFATFAGVAGGSLIGGLDMSIGNIAATCLLVTLLGLAFGGLALAIGSATGRVRLGVFGAVSAALVSHVLNSFLPLSSNENVAGLAEWTPFHFYLGGDPLNNGLDWGHASVLVGLFLILVAAAVVLFQRRDLRQTD